MSQPLATYSFLPWMRQGLSNNITQNDASVTVKPRASINIKLNLNGVKPDNSALANQLIEKDIDLYGPGDIIGIDTKSIVKTEPKNWITKF